VNKRLLSKSSLFPTVRQTTNALSLLLVILLVSPVQAQRKRTKPPAHPAPTKAEEQLAKVRDEYIQATKDYKASLEKLLAIYVGNEQKAEQRLAQARELFTQGLVAKREVDDSERALASAKEKSEGVRKDMATADGQIANTLVETQVNEQMARSPRLGRGALINTTSYIRYNGPGAWSLSEAWKPENFFRVKFGRALPIAVFGQGSIHNRWRLDHRNAMDVELHPDSVEGQALMTFLRSNGIPFTAFRGAIPGTATGPHIHVGLPSHRY
jgi:hypothetical protein